MIIVANNNSSVPNVFHLGTLKMLIDECERGIRYYEPAVLRIMKQVQAEHEAADPQAVADYGLQNPVQITNRVAISAMA